MRLFSSLYDRALTWSRHPHAPWYLSALSFAESSFFPIPPDVMLAPMSLAQPRRAMFFASMTTIASTVGGVAGYLIGYFLIGAVEPMLVELGWMDGYVKVSAWFGKWGIWAVFIAGFSPVPYKLFTIAAGAAAMSMPGFVLASFIGRGARFFLVASLIRWGGEPMEKQIRRHIDTIGWLTIILLLILWLVFGIE